MNLKDIHSAYFVGIGGIGMSAIARYFHHRGVRVFGYDRWKNPICDELMSAGIPIHYTDDPDQIPQQFTEAPKDRALVVYTPAVPRNQRILTALKAQGYVLLKRAQALGKLVEKFRTIAVAGTHGKTTTSALIAHILTESGVGCNAFLGGISTDYNSNLLVDDDSPFAVVEADEYDRSFLSLHPELAVVTSLESDHLDIYGDENQLLDAFRQFVKQVKPNGWLFTKKGLPDLQAQSEQQSYSLNNDADIVAEHIEVINAQYTFDIRTKEQNLKGLKLGLPGRHNVENALAAVGVAMALKVDSTAIRHALQTFSGVKRRFEVHVKSEECVYIDDYAHHPSEIKAFVSSVREMHPEKSITGIFQPHLFSRTRDLADDFAAALSLLDEVILLEIYPAREAPIPGVTAEMLLKKISVNIKSVMDADALLARIKMHRPEVLLTMGAGDIDQLVSPIRKVLAE